MKKVTSEILGWEKSLGYMRWSRPELTRLFWSSSCGRARTQAGAPQIQFIQYICYDGALGRGVRVPSLPALCKEQLGLASLQPVRDEWVQHVQESSWDPLSWLLDEQKCLMHQNHVQPQAELKSHQCSPLGPVLGLYEFARAALTK